MRLGEILMQRKLLEQEDLLRDAVVDAEEAVRDPDGVLAVGVFFR